MKTNVIERIEGDAFRGNYKVWGKPRLDFHLVPNAGKVENAPDFLIEATDPLGDKMVIGSAYKNTIKEGDKVGQEYFSVKLDEPTVFRQPLHLVAFSDDRTFYGLTPSKPKASGEGEQAQAA